ncbi:response regulator [Dyadobacter sp. 676]|uniref:Response regulator n=1 Tax=Dyadobacter sp. 676 TaxID=3088362 RepID=A0AAU8FWY7_9BACT
MTALTIRMLRENKHFSPEQIAVNSGGYADIVIPEKIAMPAIINAAVSKQNNTILIVEDNGQLRVFLREIFEGQYNILEAENGLQGLELANAHIPDIILSDVMMPEMSGLDLCNKLKTSAGTSHIPIVLLTAKTQSEQIIEGLAAGADDYLAKPFNPRILELKIDNLIRVRDEQKKRFRQLALEGEEAENSIAQNVNEAFIANLRTLVKENISNRDFGVNELAGHVGMSLSVLYRKMRALTGLTINEFVKAIRLNVARELLESGVYNVSEVATMIGFEDAKYFSKEFRKVFGKNPNEVKKMLS